jgi:hypothetical protein
MKVLEGYSGLLLCLSCCFSELCCPNCPGGMGATSIIISSSLGHFLFKLFQLFQLLLL